MMLNVYELLPGALHVVQVARRQTGAGHADLAWNLVALNRI
jgi:hypothetical protein